MKDEVRRLEALSSSPYAVEPPRKSSAVDLLMTLARMCGFRPLVTPHLHGGTNEAKVHWEYDQADTFWDVVAGFADPTCMASRDVLDVGCGWGGKAIRYAEETGLRSITGFDLPGVFDPAVPSEFARARGLENCSFTLGRAESAPFPDASFDVVIMDDVLEHVHDPALVLDECRRVLRSGGTLVARFPSIRMLTAHHLDRAIRGPGLHYLLPLRTWAAGLNHYLLHNRLGLTYEPFSRVVETRFRPGVTENLNGLDLKAFSRVANASRLKVEALGLAAYPRKRFGRTASVLYPIYRAARRIPPLEELLSRSIVLVGKAE